MRENGWTLDELGGLAALGLSVMLGIAVGAWAGSALKRLVDRVEDRLSSVFDVFDDD